MFKKSIAVTAGLLIVVGIVEMRAHAASSPKLTAYQITCNGGDLDMVAILTVHGELPVPSSTQAKMQVSHLQQKMDSGKLIDIPYKKDAFSVSFGPQAVNGLPMPAGLIMLPAPLGSGFDMDDVDGAVAGSPPYFVLALYPVYFGTSEPQPSDHPDSLGGGVLSVENYTGPPLLVGNCDINYPQN